MAKNHVKTNIFRGLKKRPSQLIGIILLVTMSIAAYVAMNNSVSSLGAKLTDYEKEQNQEDFQFYMNPSIENFSIAEQNSLYNAASIAGLTFGQGNATDYINHLSTNTPAYFASLDLIETVIFDTRANTAASEFDFLWESHYYSTIKNGSHVFTVTDYEEEDTINEPLLIDGVFPTADNEVALFPQYMESNNISIGDNFELDINGDETIDSSEQFKVVGSFYRPDFIQPILEINNPFYDKETMSLVLTTSAISKQASYSTVPLTAYSAKFVDENNNYIDVSQEEMKIKIEELRVHYGLIHPEKSDYNQDYDKSIIVRDKLGFFMSKFNNPRISSIQNEIESNKTMSLYLSGVILGLSLVVIGFMMRKRIENDGKQLGVLKSLGYKNSTITNSYLIIPIVSAVIGGLLGYFLGIGLSVLITSAYKNVYLLPIGGFSFDLGIFLVGVILPGILLIALSFIVIYLLLRTRAVDLLKPGNKMDMTKDFPSIKNAYGDYSPIVTPLRVIFYIPILFSYFLGKMYNLFKKIFLKLIKGTKFITRFRYSLALRSPGKLAGIFFTIYISSMLMVIALIGSSLMGDLVDTTFGDIQFDTLVTYNNPKEFVEDTGSSDYLDPEKNDVVYNLSVDLTTINGVASTHDKTSMSIFAAKPDAKLNKLFDEDGNDISEKVADGIVLADVASKIHNISIGDELVFTRTLTQLDYTNPALYTANELTDLYNNKLYIKDLDGNKTYIKSNAEVDTALGNNDLLYYDTEPIEVVGISAEFFNSNAYYDFGEVNEFVYNTKSEGDSYKYTGIYTNEDVDKSDPNIALTLTFDELKGSIEKGLDLMSVFINVMVVIAGILSLVIIVVMTNFTIEDNFQNISLLKVMGYNKKETSKMVLRIYGPIVIIAFLLAVPSTVGLLNGIFDALAKDTGISIPVKPNPLKSITGGITIAISYFVALQISKRAINKISLQEALKED